MFSVLKTVFWCIPAVPAPHQVLSAPLTPDTQHLPRSLLKQPSLVTLRISPFSHLLIELESTWMLWPEHLPWRPWPLWLRLFFVIHFFFSVCVCVFSSYLFICLFGVAQAHQEHIMYLSLASYSLSPCLSLSRVYCPTVIYHHTQLLHIVCRTFLLFIFGV